MTGYRAPILTGMALHWLRERFPDALLTTELAVAKYGDASLDVAAVTDRGIFGIEVKGDGDSPARLERQGWVYSRAALHMWLLPSPSLEARAKKHRPRGWGFLTVAGAGLKERGQIYENLPLPNAPAALLDILWKPELVAFAKSQGVRVTSRHASQEIARSVAEAVPLGTVRAHVCQVLLAREWEKPPYAKRVFRAYDDLPEIGEPVLPSTAAMA